MGVLGRLFGGGKSEPPSSSLSPQVRASFEAAATDVGWRSIRWEGSRAYFEARGKQRFAGLDSFLASLVEERRAPTTADISAYVKKLDGLLAADDERRKEAKDLTRIKDRLRPRLLTPETVAAAPDLPSNVYVADELLEVLAIDYPDTSTFVNASVLATWGVSFDNAWAIALHNLQSIATSGEFEPLPGHRDILLCSTADTIASSRAFVLPDIFPEHHSSLGFLFSVPSSDALLAHVIKGSSSIAIPPLMLSLALPLLQSRPHPLNASVFWQRARKAVRLNLTATKGRTGAPEINFIAAGHTEEFMNTLSRHA